MKKNKLLLILFSISSLSYAELICEKGWVKINDPDFGISCTFTEQTKKFINEFDTKICNIPYSVSNEWHNNKRIESKWLERIQLCDKYFKLTGN
jgi:hypothetical protein